MLKCPPLLEPGDCVAIVSPASAVKPEFVESAADFLRAEGYEPLIGAHARGRVEGNYSGSLAERLSDFRQAWLDERVKAVVCGRGGYGAVHLLSHLPQGMLSAHPKWLVGFSDITALHARLQQEGLMSLHAPMTKDLHGAEGRALLEILATGNDGGFRPVAERRAGLPADRRGEGRGVLIGGNMAVFNGLMGTPYDICEFARRKDAVLLIEDIAEPPYKIERMLYQMMLAGMFERIRGLVVGRFTEYSTESESEMEWMIERFLTENKLTGFPVVYDYPVGHIEQNRPVILGSEYQISVK